MKRLSLIKAVIVSMFFIVVLSMSILAKGWTTDGYDWHYIDYNDVMVTESIQSSGDDRYYLDVNGNMVRDYLLEDFNDAVYYFDDSGKMVRNTWVAVDPSQVENAMDNPPTIYLYYFGSNGKAYKSKGSTVERKTIDGKKYIFNSNGQMLSGWINEQGDRYNEFDTEDDPFVGYVYYAGDETDGVLREGWSSYEDGSVEDRYYMKDVLWFYFKANDNKKVYYDGSDVGSAVKKRVINGKTYAFDENGVMIEGWDSDMLENPKDVVTKNYFSEKEKDLGRMNKKEWIFAVPSEYQDQDDHNQEVERWFYAIGNGDTVKNQVRKINSQYYAFNDKGIMQKGLCIVNKYTKAFVDSIDIEKTDGKDFIVSRRYISANRDIAQTKDYCLFNDKENFLFYFMEDEAESTFGQRKIGDVKVAFGDKDYTFASNNLGEYEREKLKKFYQAGIRLEADDAVGLGLVLLGYSSDSEATSITRYPEYMCDTQENFPYAGLDKNHEHDGEETGEAYPYSEYIVKRQTYDPDVDIYPVFAVVDTRGGKVKASNTVRKDKSGYYWAIGPRGYLMKVFEVPIKYVKSKGQWQFKSEIEDGDKVKTKWIPFGQQDVYGKKCELDRAVKGDYELKLDETYFTNFRYED